MTRHRRQCCSTRSSVSATKNLLGDVHQPESPLQATKPPVPRLREGSHYERIPGQFRD